MIAFLFFLYACDVPVEVKVEPRPKIIVDRLTESVVRVVDCDNLAVCYERASGLSCFSIAGSGTYRYETLGCK